MDRTQQYEDVRDAAERACQKYACQLQDCLQKNDYQEKGCRHWFNKYEECVEKKREELKLNK